LLAWAFKELRSREGDYESLVIKGDTVIVEWHRGTQQGHRELNRHWVRVSCGCKAPGKNCCISISSHGRATELGRHLTDEARLQLAATLRSRLQG